MMCCLWLLGTGQLDGSVSGLVVMGTTTVLHHSHNQYVFYTHNPSDSETRTVEHQIAFLGRFKLTELRMASFSI
jgi:hypothetical protein